jgi:spermidine synthase
MDKRLGRAVIFSAVVLGATSIISQVAVFRELFIIFYGNELSIGLALACWLFWVAIGSWGFGRFAGEAARKPESIIYIQASTALLIPLTMLLSRCAKNIFPLSPGEMIGIGPMLLASTVVLAPLCLVLGFTFALLCASRRLESPGASGVGAVYVLEALGSTSGGLLFSLALIRFLTPTQTSFILSGLNLTVASVAARSARVRLFPLALLTAYIIAFLSGATGKLEEVALTARWRGFELEYNANSIYGNVAVVSLEGEVAFYENGFFSFSTGDDRSAEETAHIPLLAHPDAESILLIGGGPAGVLREILKHPVQKATYVELDPLIIQAARTVLPERTSDLLHDHRVDLVFADGRRFVKNSSAKYDVVILNLPDPLTALVNRFYSQEFFQEVDDVLAPGGILSTGLTLGENYLNPEQQRLLASIHNTLSLIFEHVVLIPGRYTHLMASNSPDLSGIRADVILARLAKLGLETTYITEGYLPFRMDKERVAFFSRSLAGAGNQGRNRDLKPTGYLYATAAWLTRLNSRSARLLGMTAGLSIWWFFLPFGFLFGATLYPTLRRADPRPSVSAAVVTTGFAEMVFQVAIIYSFQVFFGHLYYRLGIILTSFMIGLAVGAFLITSRMAAIREPGRLFFKIQMGVCLYPILLATVILLFSHYSRSAPFMQRTQLAFALLPAVAGVLGGAQFPLAARICLSGRASVGRIAGSLYGMDLVGSCVGAVMASALLVPVVGVLGACFVAFAGSCSSLLLVFLSSARRRRQR